MFWKRLHRQNLGDSAGRRGSLLLVLTFTVVMAIIMAAMVKLSSTLTTTSKDSAKIYASIQSYRTATELATYAYLTQIEAATVTKDMDSDWLSVSSQTIYAEAVDAIFKEYCAEDWTDVGYRWSVDDIIVATAGIDVSNQEVLDILIEELSPSFRQEFSLTVPEPIEFDFSNAESWADRDSARLVIKPFDVDVRLLVKSEEILETFRVSGLYLDLMYFNQTMADGTRHSMATMQITAGDEGVEINRVAF